MLPFDSEIVADLSFIKGQTNLSIVKVQIFKLIITDAESEFVRVIAKFSMKTATEDAFLTGGQSKREPFEKMPFPNATSNKFGDH